jgi:peptidoglycan/xylan/chitin deacetylase (PgdA/CDA1 family)
MRRPLPVLMYHEYHPAIVDHLEWVLERGYDVAHLHEMQSYFTGSDAPFPEKKIVFTFDDAYQDFSKVARIFAGMNCKVTVCVPTGYIAEEEQDRQSASWAHGSGQPLLIWNELRQLTKLETTRGEPLVEVIPHSVWHVSFDDEAVKGNLLRLHHEISYSKETLINRLGIPNPRFFCFPGGAGWKDKEDEPVNVILKEYGYIGALRAEYRGETWNQYCIPRWEGSSIAYLLK